MKYEYNGHLLEEERINLVVKEIVEKYPLVSVERAKEVAMLEGRISSEISIDDVLNRLYNIMLVNCDNENVVYVVYKDYLSALKRKDYNESDKYFSIIQQIDDYFQGFVEFPIISEVEEN